MRTAPTRTIAAISARPHHLTTAPPRIAFPPGPRSAQKLDLPRIVWIAERVTSGRGALAGTILTRVGLPGLMPLPWSQTFAIFAYAMVSCLVVNDAVKVVMIKWRVPTAIA